MKNSTVYVAHHNFNVIDYCVFIFLLLSSTLIGVFFWFKDRNKKDNDAYLTGNKKLKVFPVAMSLAASFMSTNTILGVPAEIYLLGTQHTVQIISIFIAIAIASYVFLPIYYDLNLVSVNKYLSLRFKSNKVQYIGSLGFILVTLPYMGVVLYGPSLALNAVTPLSDSSSILVVGAICTFYTSIGGIKAVIWSDVLQCILMINCLLMIVIVGCLQIGFIEPFRIVSEGGRLVLFNLDLNIYRNDNFWVILIGTLITWTGTYGVKQTQVQRYCCLESKSKARQALYWNLPILVLIALLAAWCGIILFAKYGDCDPISMNIVRRHDQLMPLFVQDTMANIPGMSGLFVVGVFSGALSTLSSGYNALATITWDDFLKSYSSNSSPKFNVIITKLLSALYGLSSIGIAFFIGKLGTVLQASMAIVGSISGPLLGLFTLGIFFPFVNAKGAIAGFSCGLLTSMFVALGAVYNLRPKIRLPVSTNGCSPEIIDFFGPPTSPDPYMHPSDYHPEGINQLFHISYYLISVMGLTICLTVGIIVSLLTGGNRVTDSRLLCDFVVWLGNYPKKDVNSNKVENISEDGQKMESIYLKKSFCSIDERNGQMKRKN